MIMPPSGGFFERRFDVGKKFVVFNPSDSAEAIANAIIESMRKEREKNKTDEPEEEDDDGGN